MWVWEKTNVPCFLIIMLSLCHYVRYVGLAIPETSLLPNYKLFDFLLRTIICCTSPRGPPILAYKKLLPFVVAFIQWKYKVSLGWLCACRTIPDMTHCIPHSPGSCQMLIVVSHHLKQKAISVRNNVSHETNNKKAGQSHKVPLPHTLKNNNRVFGRSKVNFQTKSNFVRKGVCFEGKS